MLAARAARLNGGPPSRWTHRGIGPAPRLERWSLHIFVVSAGSSSLKLGVRDGDSVSASKDLPSLSSEDLDRVLGDLLDELSAAGAGQHRVKLVNRATPSRARC
jgi:hypothetical protein